MPRPRLVIAGTHSGVGKTTVTLALMAALEGEGLVVQTVQGRAGFYRSRSPSTGDGSARAIWTGGC